MRFVMPLILVGIAVAVFFVFTAPFYNELSLLRQEAASYNEALGNSKALENERDKLTAKYNSFNPEDLVKLEKLLPENVDNIRLILEIEQIASPYGMALRNVKYSIKEEKPVLGEVGVIQEEPVEENKEYGTFEMEFTTSGSYDDFMSFTRDLEQNLRIVDIKSVTFSSGDKGGLEKKSSADVYEYNFKIKTYWLKD